MAKNLNQVVLIGHLGQDPELRTFQNGGSIANFNLAVADDYKNQQGEIIKRTHWLPIAVSGSYANVAQQYLAKGSKIRVSGKLVQETWQDQNGNNRSALKIHATDFEMLDSRKAGEQGQQPQAKAPPAEPPMDSFDDDIPF